MPNLSKGTIQRIKLQKLSTWKPVMTFGSLSFLFLFISSVYIPLGACLIYFNYIVNEKEITYSGKKCIPNRDLNSSAYDSSENESSTSRCLFTVEFNLSYQFMGQVYMYYVLTNFYQSHRKYIRSYDASQLIGGKANEHSCSPLFKDPENNLTYAPCGVIANSMFNDTFQLIYNSNLKGPIDVPISKMNIAWSSDKKSKYKNPKSWNGTTKPKDWTRHVNELDPDNPNNNGYQNEALIVWMRTAAFPTFRKLYGRINHTSNEMFNEGLPAGLYTLVVDNNYPTDAFGGSKRVFFTTTSWIGSKNFVTGIAYLVIGSACLMMITMFKIVNHFYEKRFRELLDRLSTSSPYFFR